MGGVLCVGVKGPDGAEQASLRWTNNMPYWFNNPCLYDGGDALTEFLALAKPDNEWPKSRLVQALESSEYGVILIDFPSKSVLSRQDYTAVGAAFTRVAPKRSGDDEKLKNALALEDRGWVTSVRSEFGWEGRGVRDWDPLPDDLRRLALDVMRGTVPVPDDLRSAHVDLVFTPTGWTIDDNTTRAADAWPEVESWLAARGWTTPRTEPSDDE